MKKTTITRALALAASFSANAFAEVRYASDAEWESCTSKIEAELGPKGSCGSRGCSDDSGKTEREICIAEVGYPRIPESTIQSWIRELKENDCMRSLADERAFELVPPKHELHKVLFECKVAEANRTPDIRSKTAMGAHLDHWRVQNKGDWITIEGFVSGNFGSRIDMAVKCDGVYAGNGTSRINANGTWSTSIFDLPNACSTVDIFRVTSDGMAVNLSIVNNSDKKIPDGHLPGFGPKDPARRCLEHNEITAVQKFVGATIDGKVGPNTMSKVVKWNRSNGIDHDYISEHLIEKSIAVLK